MKTSKKLIVAFILLATSLLPANVYAWQEEHSASAVCDGENVKVEVSFKNKESGGAEKCMSVVAEDQESGNSVNLGNVNPGETKTGTINLNTSATDGGKVIFELEWCSDSHGTDSRESTYSTLDCRKEEEEKLLTQNFLLPFLFLTTWQHQSTRH